MSPDPEYLDDRLLHYRDSGEEKKLGSGKVNFIEVV
jgi:hypothetical protein